MVCEIVRNSFRFRILPQPTITQNLRQKALGAYDHVAARYSFLTQDVGLGAKIFESSALNRTGYEEYEKNFNSVLLGTFLNALVNGSMIFFGPPGSGKTMTPEVVGQVLFGLSLEQIEEATIYGHPNLTEEKMTASFDIPKLMQGQKEVVWSPWVLESYRMLDEANRIAPETSAILLQAIDRRRVSYAGQVTEMPYGPVYATANYYDAGNFEMTKPFLDRFGISVHTEGLSPQDIDMLFMPEDELDRESYALNKEEREQAYAEIQSIGIDKSTMSLLSHLASGLSSCGLAGNMWYDKHKGRFGEQAVECDGSKCGFDASKVVCSQIKEQGLTSRGLIALRDYSRAFAWLLGRESVDNEVMKIIFALVNAHRLTPSKIAMNGGESAEGVQIDKSRFTRRTFDFNYHIWELALNGFEAQNPIYAEINRFYDDIAGGAQSAQDLLTRSDEILIKVDAMEDPAKWEILKSLHRARQILRARG